MEGIAVPRHCGVELWHLVNGCATMTHHSINVTKLGRSNKLNHLGRPWYLFLHNWLSRLGSFLDWFSLLNTVIEGSEQRVSGNKSL